MIDSGIVSAAGGGYPPGGGGGGPPGGGWGPPPGAPPGGGYPPGGGGPPGGGYPPGGGGPPGGGYPPGGGGPPGGGWGPPPGAPPGGAPPGGYGPPGSPPGGGGYGPPGGGYGGPPGGGPPGGGYGAPPGGAPPGGYGPPGGAPPGPYGGGFLPPHGHAPPVQGAAAPGATWSPTDAIGFGWNSLMKNFVGLGVGMFVTMLIIVLPIGAVVGVLMFSVNLLLEFLDAEFLPTFMMIAYAGIGLYALIAGAFLAGGIMDVALRTARGEITTIGHFFKGGRYFGSFLVAGILLSLAVWIGSLLCLVPGVILYLGLTQTYFLIIDRGLSPVDALKESWRMTMGHKMNIFVYTLLGFLVALAGELACYVGVYLVSMPVILIGQAYIYLKLKGEQPRLIGA